MRRARGTHAVTHAPGSSLSRGSTYPVLRPLPRHQTGHVEATPQGVLQQRATGELLTGQQASSTPSAQTLPHQGDLTQAMTEQLANQQRPSTRMASVSSVATCPTEDPLSISPDTAYFGDSGILPVFEQDHRGIARSSQGGPVASRVSGADLPPLELIQSFAETYLEYCWPWCPVLDGELLLRRIEHSPPPLLVNALALLGTRIRPPILQHAEAADYYFRAKMLFYTDQEDNPMICLQSLMLFYWWAPQR